ncbi:MAG: copper resistance protein B [Thiolinea sp.]
MKIYPHLFSATCLLAVLLAPLAQAQSTCTPEHAAMGHCTMDVPKAEAAKSVSKPDSKPEAKASSACTAEHAAMGHCKMEEASAKEPPKPVSKPKKAKKKQPTKAKPISSEAKSLPEKSQACTPEHAAMGHCTMNGSTPKASAQAKPVAKPSAPASSTCTPEHAAMGHCTLDSGLPVSDGSAATNIPMPYHQAMDMNDDPFLSKVMIDRFEVRKGDHGNPVILEADAWFGKSVDKLWLKTDIEAVDGDLEEAQLQVLYNRAISPFWDVQAGIRHDFKPVKRTWAALGVQGTAQYFIETDATLFLGKSGQTALNVSAEKEVMLTQKTVLIPELAMTLYGKDDHELGVGSGVSDLNVGLRLSHELRREFAPYVGVNWSKKLGKTADLAEHHGDKTQDTEFLLGIQAWF